MSKEMAPIPADQIHAAQLAASTVTSEAIGWMNAAELSGSIKTAGFFATVADRLLVDAYAKAKESKSYMGMPYRAAGGSVATVASLDEYCQAFLGKSYRRCEELLSNRRLVGEDLYEQAEALGFRQRDYNALKALPAEDREVISRALEAGADRETVIEQLVTLTERQIAQKAKLAEELTEAREKVAKRDETIAETSKHISELRDSVSHARRAWVQMSPDQQREKLKIEITKAVTAVEHPISEHNENGGLHGALCALHAHLVEHGGNEAHWVISQLNELQRQIEMLKLRWSAAV